ncbi:MAG: sigma 54-interacting transcriptional regulator [Myxococcaceae bacterium]
MSDQQETVPHLALGKNFPDGTFIVRVVEGPNAGKQLEVDGSTRVLVGTSEVCALRLDDRKVSRRHLALEVIGARLRATDIGSTNGTHIGSLTITEASLGGGESVRLGDTVLSVTYSAAGANPVVPAADRFGRLLGQSRAMRRLYPQCEKLAAARVPVIIEGETGTGKEVLAESLHEKGPLADKPYVVFDCTAAPPTLIESELFGHEKGAFTGATSTRQGVFEQANGGTLLIDEIGDLELSLQPKLLRALERGEVRRVGGDKSIAVDVRVLAATRRDLDQEVQAGRFRDDLFHRLAVTRIELPPLREREGDVRFLARHFWSSLGGPGEPPARAMALWETSSWPGNVRELRNAVARQLALGDEPTQTEETAIAPGADVIESILAQDLSLPVARDRVIAEFERRFVKRALAQHGGNVSRAAAALGIARRHFQRLKAKSK